MELVLPLVVLLFSQRAQSVAPRAISSPVPTVLVGRVLTPEGLPAPGVEVVTSAGGAGVTALDGTFELPVEVPSDARYVDVTAVSNEDDKCGASSATARVRPAAFSATTSVGRLQLVRSSDAPARWLPEFPPTPGTNGPVLACTVFDDGNGPALLAGGDFTSAGGVTVNRVGRWNGERWSALDVGTNGSVRALTTCDLGSGPALYAGGDFTSAGGVPANRIARWDGTSWSALGTGLSGSVSALASFDDGSGPALYAGGDFVTAGGVAANRVAKWDGTSWSALGSGVADNAVLALAAFNDGSGPALYVGGSFTSAGGVPASRIARWDGSTWSEVGGGIAGGIPPSPRVFALAVFDGGAGPALYVGGRFTSAGGVGANNVAKWTGSSWSALQSGTDHEVSALAVFDVGAGPGLYAGGGFSTAGFREANSIARWNGSGWRTVGSGMSASVLAIAGFETARGPVLFAGGSSLALGNSPNDTVTYHIAAWDGANWKALGGGMTYAEESLGVLKPRVDALAAFDDGAGQALYAGGYFTSAGDLDVDHVVRWDGSGWSTLGFGLNGPAFALCAFDDGSGSSLYVGGRFDNPGHRIARWDGSGWSVVGLGGGIDGDVVNDLAVFDDGAGAALYAAGFFFSAGGVPAHNIGRWNGSSWSEPGSGILGQIYALVVFDDGSGPALYAGGDFITAGGVAVDRVSKWDGASWSALASGNWLSVRALSVFDDGSGPALYAGGAYVSGGVSANRVARLDGTSWSTLGSGMNGLVHALASFDDGSGPALYASGEFTSAGGVAANRIARWDGTNWSALGNGLNSGQAEGGAFALTVYDDGSGPALYASGDFAVSPRRDGCIAKWGRGRRVARKQ